MFRCAHAWLIDALLVVGRVEGKQLAARLSSKESGIIVTTARPPKMRAHGMPRMSFGTRSPGSGRCMAVFAARLFQPLLGECRVHKESDPLRVHQLLLSAKGWCIIAKNGDVLDMTL